MFNKVILLGNLTKDIELRYLPNGTALSKTAIAVNNKYVNTAGNKVEETMYIDCTFWGRTAENANKYLRRGSKLLLEGTLMFEKWVDNNGANRSKHTLKVIKMEMLDSKPAAQTQGNIYQHQQQPQQQQQAYGSIPTIYETISPVPPIYAAQIDIPEDEIPF